MMDAGAIVLAGGQSRRFAGDKARALLQGEPVVARLCRRLLEQFAQVALVAKTPDLHRTTVPSGVALVADLAFETNPLVGLRSGLIWARAEIVFAVACDMPFAAAPLVVSRLWTACAGQNAAAFTWKGQPEPLCAFYRRDPCLPVVTRKAEEGLGPRHVLAEVGARLVSYEEAFPEDREGLPFLDIDTPEDLARAEAKAI